MRTYPFHYAHGGELIVSHDTIRDGFTSIVREMKFHVSHEQIHVLPSPPFKLFIGKLTSYYLLMVLTPSPMLSLPLSLGLIWFLMLFHFKLWLWQLKQRKDLAMIGIWQLAFLPLTMEVFGCQHQHMDGFFHWCANMVWLAKGSSGSPLAIWCTFYKQKGFNSFAKSVRWFNFQMHYCCKWGLF